jgi:hypothetical protein
LGALPKGITSLFFGVLNQQSPKRNVGAKFFVVKESSWSFQLNFGG